MSNTPKLQQQPSAGGPVRIMCAGLVGVSGQDAPDMTGAYLESYDPEAHDGRGYVNWTMHQHKARVFPDFTAAFECWRQVPACRPVRPDGRPNRPMTAFNITFEQVT